MVAPVTSTSNASNDAKLSPLSWIDPSSIPLHERYRWQSLAPSAHDAKGERFEFEELCHSTRSPESNEYGYLDSGGVITERSRLGDPDDTEWQVQEQIAHWPGDSLKTSQYASTSLGYLMSELKSCAETRVGATVVVSSETPRDVAVVITAPQAEGITVLHDYFALSACGGAIAELALWTSTPPGGQPKTTWQAPADEKVLTAITDPLCSVNQGN